MKSYKIFNKIFQRALNLSTFENHKIKPHCRIAPDVCGLYTIPDQYRCVPEIVADRGSVYTQDGCTFAFYATEQQRNAPK